MLHVGFTGTKEGMTIAQLTRFTDVIFVLAMASVVTSEKRYGHYLAFHHGDCVGADAEAHDIVHRTTNAYIYIHPPTNDAYQAHKIGNFNHPPKPYLERNHDIVDESNILIATPGQMQEKLRSGTWATIRYAKYAKKVMIPIIFIWPNGTVNSGE